jgi:hypothetical protein
LIAVVMNRSRKKAFRRTKRLVTTVLPSISNRVNIGDVPKRVLLELVKNLRHGTTKGVCIQLFFEEKEGFRGFKCIEFGTKSYRVKDFVNVDSRFDLDLAAKGLLGTP